MFLVVAVSVITIIFTNFIFFFNILSRRKEIENLSKWYYLTFACFLLEIILLFWLPAPKYNKLNGMNEWNVISDSYDVPQKVFTILYHINVKWLHKFVNFREFSFVLKKVLLWFLLASTSDRKSCSIGSLKARILFFRTTHVTDFIPNHWFSQSTISIGNSH